MQSDYFRTLFDYNWWANQRVLDAAAQVSDDDYFAAVPGLSFGSLHATLVHAVVGEQVWISRFEGGLPPEALKDARIADALAVTELPTFDDVRSLYAAVQSRVEAFAAALTDDACESDLSYHTQYGEPNTQPLNQLIGHFINHSTQFRAEASVRLTQLGISPGDTDLIIYLRTR
jgi:uncharacterized damage-inducible protein DinB